MPSLSLLLCSLFALSLADTAGVHTHVIATSGYPLTLRIPSETTQWRRAYAKGSPDAPPSQIVNACGHNLGLCNKWISQEDVSIAEDGRSLYMPKVDRTDTGLYEADYFQDGQLRTATFDVLVE